MDGWGGGVDDRGVGVGVGFFAGTFVDRVEGALLVIIDISGWMVFVGVGVTFGLLGLVRGSRGRVFGMVPDVVGVALAVLA